MYFWLKLFQEVIERVCVSAVETLTDKEALIGMLEGMPTRFTFVSL
jgi:hypothetical protein